MALFFVGERSRGMGMEGMRLWYHRECNRIHGGGSHAMPSLSASWRSQYPGFPRYAGASPMARTAPQLGNDAKCFTVAMMGHGEFIAA